MYAQRVRQAQQSLLEDIVKRYLAELRADKRYDMSDRLREELSLVGLKPTYEKNGTTRLDEGPNLLVDALIDSETSTYEKDGRAWHRPLKDQTTKTFALMRKLRGEPPLTEISLKDLAALVRKMKDNG